MSENGGHWPVPARFGRGVPPVDVPETTTLI